MPCFLLKGNISKKWLTIECSLGIVVCGVVLLDFFGIRSRSDHYEVRSNACREILCKS